MNQRIVFDLIAMLQDGIATVTRLSSTEGSSEGKEKSLDGSFGLGQAFSSLLKVNLATTRRTSSQDNATLAWDDERVHTPASLFYKVRERLKEKNQLISIDDKYNAKNGDIIEFSSVLHRNPLVQFLDAFGGLLDIMAAFSEQPRGAGKRRAATDPSNVPFSRVKEIQNQLTKISDGVKSGDTIDLVSDDIGNGYQAVITVQQEFLNDPTLSDLVDGHFRVSGKVTRVIYESNEGISLLRKSAMNVLHPQKLQEAFGGFQDIQEFNVPKLEYQVNGPVIQIIPIAIYA